jgi:hypothetical protein
MKQLLLIILSFIILSLVTHARAAVGKSLNYEGSCSGQLRDGTEVNLTYYSDFDGCKTISRSAITFSSGIEGLFTGSRSFKGKNDVYNFPKHRLTFTNSTGNTSALFQYRDTQNELIETELQCEVRDYEYAECL